MVPEVHVPMAKKVKAATTDKPGGTSVSFSRVFCVCVWQVDVKDIQVRSTPNKRNNEKVPKKIHKAEREKLKRDHLNELFLELGNAVEPARQNSGKASMLGEATRFLRDLLVQVEFLKKENAALLSESHYVTIEKNELKDENSVLEADIEKLQTELQDRAQVKPSWDAAPSQLQHKNIESQLSEDCLTLPIIDPSFQQPAVVGPVFVIPLHERQGCPEPENSSTPSKPPSNVSRPHARYPTPSDSWPSRLLVKQPASEDCGPRQCEQ